MKIGSKVLVKALAEPRYIDGENRKLVRAPFSAPKEMYYTGYTFRCEGKYHDSTVRSHFHGTQDFDSAYLAVTKTIKVARVKTNERENDKFCLMEDLEEAAG